jgi:hypothetical protein
MTDTAPKPPSTGAIAAIISALPSEVRGIYALINMPTYFKNLASSSSAKEQCWELREIQSAIFKFNRCDGSVSQVELKQSPATANTASKQ